MTPRRYGIRARILLAAVLPLTLVAVLLSAVFMLGRMADVEQAHLQQEKALIRQLAAASEFGVFAGAVDNLQSLVNGAMREPDVLSVTILDSRASVLARAGTPGYTALPLLGRQEYTVGGAQGAVELLVQPIAATRHSLGDMFERNALAGDVGPQLLGHVLVEFSRESLQQRQRRLLLLGLGVALGGLALSWALALRIARGVIQPVLRVSRRIERIGQGDFVPQDRVREDDPLRDLQLGLNDMALRLKSGRDELRQQVQAATLELRERKEEAETATRAKSRFLAAASHDLRQPTHALGMFVARLAQLSADDESKRVVAGLDASVRALQDMLDALLDLSKLEAEVVPVRLLAFPLDGVFEQVRAAFATDAAAKGLRLRLRPTGAWVQSDPIVLHRILLNLVSNAVRYTEHGTVLVACRTAADGQSVRIEVRDSGIGISKEHQQKVFGEFYQVGNLERDRTKGLGLGLSIVERSCRLLGHGLTMRSQPGCGTRFCVTVPLASAEPDNPSESAPDSVPLDELAGLQVLVVEDDSLGSTALADLLQSWGCGVLLADGQQTACDRLRQGPAPDVIVSDYRLRDGHHGIGTVRLLREIAGRPIPACLMSGDTDTDVMLQAKAAGLVLLHKPVRPAKLRNLLRRLGKEAQQLEKP
jgi:signal transduction histidine kinase